MKLELYNAMQMLESNSEAYKYLVKIHTYVYLGNNMTRNKPEEWLSYVANYLEAAFARNEKLGKDKFGLFISTNTSELQLLGTEFNSETYLGICDAVAAFREHTKSGTVYLSLRWF